MTDIRIRGTEDECGAFVEWMKKRIAGLRSVSGWYQDNRRGQQSMLGRVYITIGDLQEPKQEAPQEKATMQIGTCHFCKEDGKKLAILMWDGNGSYAGVCPDCARTYLDEQYAGNYIHLTHPESYAQLQRKLNPKFLAIYSGPTGMQDIWDEGSDPMEGMP